MSMSSSSALSLDHHHHHLLPSEQLYYVHCNICDTVLAVSVPCTSLFNTVTVRCGHCSNLLPLNMRGLLMPSANHQLHFGHTTNFFSPNNHLGGTSNPTTNFFMNQATSNDNLLLPRAGHNYELPRPPVVNRPPEKKQRVPSAYNRFIKEEIQRIKAVNPDISHREAFSAAAKNWAHFPNIQFGLMPDQTIKKTTNMCSNEDGEGGVLKDGYFSSTNVGVSPY